MVFAILFTVDYPVFNAFEFRDTSAKRNVLDFVLKIALNSQRSFNIEILYGILTDKDFLN